MQGVRVYRMTLGEPCETETKIAEDIRIYRASQAIKEGEGDPSVLVYFILGFLDVILFV